MKLRILGSKAKETTDTIKDKFMDGLGIEIRTSLITHADSDAEVIAKYADLLWEMKTPATIEQPIVKSEPSALTETLSTILSYVKQEKSDNSRGRERQRSSDSTKRYDSSNRCPVATPETKEITDIGAATTLIPMRGLDIGAQVTILAMAKDHVIKAPATAHAATTVQSIKAPEMTEDQVMNPIAIGQQTTTDVANHPVYMSQRAMVAVSKDIILQSARIPRIDAPLAKAYTTQLTNALFRYENKANRKEK
jgi:hypothetical protein